LLSHIVVRAAPTDCRHAFKELITGLAPVCCVKSYFKKDTTEDDLRFEGAHVLSQVHLHNCRCLVCTCFTDSSKG